jgi:diadenosine tetraphosphate (Ap4A) HIT family hydrolase
MLLVSPLPGLIVGQPLAGRYPEYTFSEYGRNIYAEMTPRMLESTSQCQFCPPALNPEYVILENTHCLFLQRQEPVLVGSGLIIPRRHCETVFDLTSEEWEATFVLLQHVKALLDHEYEPQGYNVGWNCGPVGGQEIFHAHLHVIPRYRDEPLAGKGIRYWLKQEINVRL